MKDLYDVGEAPPLGTVPPRMHAWLVRQDRFGEPRQAFQREVVDVPEIAADEVLLARRALSPRTPLTALPAAEELASQRRDRMPAYESAARLVVDTAALDADGVADRVAAWWDALPL